MRASKQQKDKYPIQNQKPGLGGRLTIKQQKWVDAYIENGGNGCKAVIDAGYDTVSEKSAQVIASQNLNKPLIRMALEQAGYQDCGLIKADEIKEARTQSEKGRRISSREDRAEFLTMIYEDNALPIRARLKAVELLCKMYGDFLERVVIKDEEPVRLPVINFVYTDDDE